MTPRIFSKLEPEGITNNRFEVSLPKYNNLRTINKEDIKSNMIRNKSEKNCISLRNEINLKKENTARNNLDLNKINSYKYKASQYSTFKINNSNNKLNTARFINLDKRITNNII